MIRRPRNILPSLRSRSEYPGDGGGHCTTGAWAVIACRCGGERYVLRTATTETVARRIARTLKGQIEGVREVVVERMADYSRGGKR